MLCACLRPIKFTNQSSLNSHTYRNQQTFIGSFQTQTSLTGWKLCHLFFIFTLHKGSLEDIRYTSAVLFGRVLLSCISAYRLYIFFYLNFAASWQNKNMKTSVSQTVFQCVWMCLTFKSRLLHDWCSQSNNQHAGLNACLYSTSTHHHAKGQVDYGMSWEHTQAQYWCHVTLIDVRKRHTYSEALSEMNVKMSDHKMKGSVHHSRMIRIWMWVTPQIEPLAEESCAELWLSARRTLKEGTEPYLETLVCRTVLAST